jgi:hypothetical protein
MVAMNEFCCIPWKFFHFFIPQSTSNRWSIFLHFLQHHEQKSGLSLHWRVDEVIFLHFYTILFFREIAHAGRVGLI